jgi:uncharacterized OsmC-like protein
LSDSLATVRLTQTQDYHFDADFGADLPPLQLDEPPPLGQGAGPSPLQLLAAAVGNCLSASLLFALRKYKQAPEPITCEVQAETGRNAENRLRVTQIHARLTLGVPAASLERLERVLDQFESFCTVTESIRAGIPVTIEVWDSTGTRLK